MSSRRACLRLTGLVSALALTGCSGNGPAVSQPASSTLALPPRPAVLALDGIDACALLTETQRRELGVKLGKRGDNIEDPHSPACDWSNFPNVPDNGWVARIITRYGADHALGSQTGVQVVTVDGFPTVQTSSPEAGDPKENCLLFIDVAPGQTLETSYQNGTGDYPGITHEVACQQATKAAELMVDTLRTLKG